MSGFSCPSVVSWPEFWSVFSSAPCSKDGVMAKFAPRPLNRERQTGRTTEQMKCASPHAMFIWCNNKLEYPTDLARFLDRTDLQIRSLSVLDTLGRAHV